MLAVARTLHCCAYPWWCMLAVVVRALHLALALHLVSCVLVNPFVNPWLWCNFCALSSAASCSTCLRAGSRSAAAAYLKPHPLARPHAKTPSSTAAHSSGEASCPGGPAPTQAAIEKLWRGTVPYDRPLAECARQLIAFFNYGSDRQSSINHQNSPPPHLHPALPLAALLRTQSSSPGGLLSGGGW